MKNPLLRATLLAGLFSVLAIVGHSQGQPPADLVLLGGKIVTVDSTVPFAQAVAIRGDRIVGVGGDNEMGALVGPGTKTIRLDGKLVIPGFIEGHAHLLYLGQSRSMLDLTHAKTWDEIVAQVRDKAKSVKPGEWIEGNGWHQDKWISPPMPNVGGLPVHDSLSLVSPDNPVVLSHASGHQCIANRKAMELAGITRNTSNPEGGEILRDSSGLPIGVFLENAQNLIYEAQQKSLSTMTPEEVVAANTKALELAMEECAADGITTFHDAGETFTVIDLMTQLAQENKLLIRLWVMIGDSTSAIKRHLSEYPRVGLGGNHLTIRAIKQFADGALGSRGAWLLEPYDDMPKSTGQILTPLDTLETIARLAAAQGLQVCIHACGDRANREILDLYERVFKSYPEKKDLRWRIEHAQHIHPVDVPRFGQLGVIAAMQGVHCTSDGPWVPSRLGEQRAVERSYLWHNLMHSGTVVINGTDAPVESVSPIACFYSSVTRKLSDGSVFAPDQTMTREEALRSYTINAAYAGFEESIKGSITLGKLADIVVLSKDIMTIPEDEIPSTEVLYTIVGGKIIYQK